jgi:hypothetical protein
MDRPTLNDRRQLRRIRALLREPWRHGIASCALCHAPLFAFDGEYCECVREYFTCVFFPDLEFMRRISPRGKQRVVVYALCSSCQESPDHDQRVEERFLQEMQIQ